MLDEKESEDFKDDDLDILKKRLYEEDEFFEQRYEREGLAPSHKKTKGYWQDSVKNKKTMRDILDMKKKKSSKKKFLAAYLFLILLISSGIVFILWKEFGNLNIVSSKKIDMTIDGPTLIDAGELNKWYINITNNNEVALEFAELVVDYPSNTISIKETGLTRERISVGEIAPGETVKEEINIYLLGAEGEAKEVNFSLEYRAAESNAILEKSVKEGMRITQSPVGLLLDLPEEVESGHEIVLDVEYVSNAQIVLPDLKLKIDYPPGFMFKEAFPEPQSENNIWNVGDLAPNEKRKIKIKGVLEGQNLTEMGFRGYVGILENLDEPMFFGLASETILLRRPFLDFNFELANREARLIKAGQAITVHVPWQNNLPVEVNDITVKAKIVGDTVNRSSIKASSGFYRSQDQSVVWNYSSHPPLKSAPPGQSGVMRFGFNLFDSFPVLSEDDKNFTFVFEGEITGYKVGKDGQSVLVKGTKNKEIKISSDVEITTKVFYEAGPFDNYGPIPQKVGSETSYTVVWSVSNLYNELSNVVVKSTLPAYIRWVDAIYPVSEDVRYNQATGEISWHIGDLEAGVGAIRPKREVAFQIAFTPALNQARKSPDLINETGLSATDNFIEIMLNSFSSNVSIKGISDPGFDSGRSSIVE